MRRGVSRFIVICLLNLNTMTFISVANAEESINIDLSTKLQQVNSPPEQQFNDSVSMDESSDLNLDEKVIAIVTPVSMVYVKKIKSPLNKIYKRIFTSLDNNGYFVVFEANIGKNLSYFAQRWGDDYNKNKLESIRSMVFCNGWYANKVSNADPEMLALCPLHITFIHKSGVTSILFIRPSSVAINSPAYDVAKELELDVIRAIEEAIRK